MKHAMHYLALSFVWLPVSALLAAVACVAWSRFARRSGNRQRNEPWLRKGPTATTQQRTRR